LTLLREIAPRVTRAATPPGSYDSFTACSAAASFIESRAILKQDFAMRGVIRPPSDFNAVLSVVFV
jgi:hypothetical protein